MNIKNCLIDKFTTQKPNKDQEFITTIVFKAVNLSKKDIGEISNYLGREIDLYLDPSIEGGDGQLYMDFKNEQCRIIEKAGDEAMRCLDELNRLEKERMKEVVATINEQIPEGHEVSIN